MFKWFRDHVNEHAKVLSLARFGNPEISKLLLSMLIKSTGSSAITFDFRLTKKQMKLYNLKYINVYTYPEGLPETIKERCIHYANGLPFTKVYLYERIIE